MRLTKIISIVLHPTFMPLIIFYISLKLIPNIGFAITSYLPFIYIVLLLSTVLLPLISVFLLIRIGQISSIEMHIQKERPTPLLIAAIWLSFAYYVLQNILVFAPILSSMLKGAIIIMFCASIISAFWEISLHMLGVGGVFGVLFSLNFLFGGLSLILIAALFACGALGVSRILENAHNHTQVYVGFIIGFFIECGSVLFH